MQRRAAAIYAAFFVVIALGAGAMYATASPSPITVEDPEYELTEGDQIEVDGNSYQVTEVNPDANATFASAEGNESTLEEGNTLTIDDETHVVHVDGEGVQLTTDIDDYESQQAVIDGFDDRLEGLYAIVVLSGLTAVLLLGLAYLPVRE